MKNIKNGIDIDFVNILDQSDPFSVDVKVIKIRDSI